MAATMEVARDEGGDDRRRDVATARLNEIFERVYPAELTDEDLQRFLEDPMRAEERQAAEQTSANRPAEPSLATRTAENGRAIYGYEPDEQSIGNVALAAAVQSSGFVPAGLQGRPGDRFARFYRRAPKRGGYPRINDVF